MLTPCFGREDVLARLQLLVGQSRWVTLTGPPGCGKTLVARHAASAAGRHVWVPAHGQTGIESLLARCLDALGADVAPGDSAIQALKRAVDEQDLLLVLDGVDDIDGLGALLDDLVEETSAFTLLCTATSVAGKPQESVLRLRPLPIPCLSQPLEGPLVELLLARVSAAGGPSIDLAEHDLMLRRLLTSSGGLPSLVEQLAVQIALVGVQDVAPVGTLAAAVRGSYELLDDEQRRCFRRLAVVGCPVSLEVLTDVWRVSRPRAVQVATALARRNLVEVMPDGRFDMLPPLRELGQGLAAESADDDATYAGLLAWAERVVPKDANSGAADEPWLAELSLMRTAVVRACQTDAGRAHGYALANRAFSSLYTAMRTRDALDLLRAVLDSGDGPPSIGPPLARRAGICASEVRGTYEGLRLLERAETHALALESTQRDLELARNSAIRAEMHLDAGNLDAAQEDVERTLALGQGDPYVVRQVRRTLMDVCVSRGDLSEARRLAVAILDSPPADEMWIALSARTLQAKIAWEQGRKVESASLAAYARDQAQSLHEDRIALLADILHRQVTGEGGPVVESESLPWAVRLVVQLQEARELLARGEAARAAGRAADIVVLADCSTLGRDAVEARLLAGDALMAMGEPAQAQAAYLEALRRAAEIPMPLRAADALDGLAGVLVLLGSPSHRQLAGAAAALRVSRRALAHVRPGLVAPVGVVRDTPCGWLESGQFSPAGVIAVTALCAEPEVSDLVGNPLGSLTRAELRVAQLVAEGHTSRQIAEQLFVSPRTVDAHLTHIFRKLDIGSRAKLAALMAEIA